MVRQWIFSGVLWAVVGVTAASAEGPTGTQPAQETAPGGVLAAAKTLAYLPFKGVVCGVGIGASFPAYWLSGMDPEVKNDTEVMRAKYCSRDYLLGSEWPQ